MAQHGTDAKTEGKNQFEQGIKPLGGISPLDPKYGETKQENLDWKTANPWGTPMSEHPGVLGKVGHVLGRVANVAGDILDPAATSLIPGSDLNNQRQAKQNQGWIDKAEEGQLRKAQEDNLESEAAERGLKKDKPVGTPQVDETGQYVQAVEHPDGTITMTPLGTRGKPDLVPVHDVDIHGTPTQGFVDPRDPKNPDGSYKLVASGTEAKKPGAETYSQFKTVPTGPNTEGIADFSKPSGGRPYTVVSPSKTMTPPQIFIDPNNPTAAPKLVDTKTAGVKDLANPSALGGAMPAAASRAEIMRQGQFNTNYLKPASDIEQNYEKFQEASREYANNPETGAAGMVMLAQHLGSTMGSVKGATTGESTQALHANAIGIADRIDRWLDKAATGQPLSASQVKEFGDLIGMTRQISWETAAKRAVEKNMPVNFLPGSVHIGMSSPDGKEKRMVPGGMVQANLDKGAKLDY
jgi:hypothetical protein